MATYRVTGPVPYRGYRPGELLIADPDESIGRALASGTLELVNDDPIRLNPESVSAPRPRPRRAAPADPEPTPEAVSEPPAEAPAVEEPVADDTNGG